MSFIIELPALWHTDSTTQLSELGLDYDIGDLERRQITFYRIDAIAANYWDEDHEFCNVFVGGEKFIIDKTYKELKEIIEKNG